jgi:hypothetical protein
MTSVEDRANSSLVQKERHHVQGRNSKSSSHSFDAIRPQRGSTAFTASGRHSEPLGRNTIPARSRRIHQSSSDKLQNLMVYEGG